MLKPIKFIYAEGNKTDDTNRKFRIAEEAVEHLHTITEPVCVRMPVRCWEGVNVMRRWWALRGCTALASRLC